MSSLAFCLGDLKFGESDLLHLLFVVDMMREMTAPGGEGVPDYPQKYLEYYHDKTYFTEDDDNDVRLAAAASLALRPALRHGLEEALPGALQDCPSSNEWEAGCMQDLIFQIFADQENFRRWITCRTKLERKALITSAVEASRRYWESLKDDQLAFSDGGKVRLDDKVKLWLAKYYAATEAKGKGKAVARSDDAEDLSAIFKDLSLLDTN
jgi:hypothetical protein